MYEADFQQTKSQLSPLSFLFTSSADLVDYHGKSMKPGFYQIQSIKKPNSFQKIYAMHLASTDGTDKSYRVFMTGEDIYKHFSIKPRYDFMAAKGIYTEMVHQLIKKHRGELDSNHRQIDPLIDWDKLIKAQVNKVFPKGSVTEEEREDITQEAVSQVFNDKTMEAWIADKKEGHSDPIKYFIGMLQLRLSNMVNKYTIERERFTPFGQSEEGEEYLPEEDSPMLEELSKEDRELLERYKKLKKEEKKALPKKDKIRINEIKQLMRQKWWIKNQLPQGINESLPVDEEAMFNYLIEDFKDYLSNERGSQYYLGIIDGMLKGKTLRQIAEEWKPKPVSNVAIGNYSKRLMDIMLQYAKETENTFLYQLVEKMKNSRKRTRTSAEEHGNTEADQIDEQEAQLVLQQDTNLFSDLFKNLKEHMEKVDLKKLLKNSQKGINFGLDLLGLSPSTKSLINKGVDFIVSSVNKHAIHQAKANKVFNSNLTIKRCALEDFLSEQNLVEASFGDQPITEKQALDYAMYEDMVSEYDDIIEEEASLYGVKSTSSNEDKTNQIESESVGLLDESMPNQGQMENALINLDGEGTSVASVKNPTDFEYQAEDDSQIDKWF